MRRKFTTTLVGAAAVIALAAATGCKKEEKGDPAAGGAPGAGGSPAAAVPAQTGFAVFPSTSKFIFGININSVRSSSLWQMYKPQIDAALSTSEMAEFKTACGFDPIAQLQTVVVGGDPQTKDIVAVVKGVGRQQVKDCAQKIATKEGKQFSSSDEGNLTMYQEGDKTVWAAWLDDTTVVVSPDKDKDFVVKRAAGDAGLAEGAEVMGLLKNVDTAATIYVVGSADAMGPNPAAQMMPGAKGFFASLKLGEGLDIDAGIRFDTPENAKNVTAMAQQQIAALKGQQVPPQMAGIVKAVEKAEVKQNGNDLVLTLKLSKQELQELSAMVQQMLQAFGGQLGGSGKPL
jgi:hypothetical protein